MQSHHNLSTFQTFRRLWPLIKPYKIGLVIAAIGLICNAGSDTYMISLLKPLLDKGFGESESGVLRSLAIIVLMLMILRGLSGFISNYCLAWVSGNVVMTLRRNLFNHMMAMPVKFFDTQSTGSLISRITYDSDQVAAASSNALITVVREGAYIIGLFVMMFYYSWALSLVLLLVAPIVSIAITLVSKRFRKISHNMQRTMGNVTTRAEQMLKGHKEVLIYNGQNIERERFETVSNQMRLQNMKLVASSAISDPVIQFIASIALVAVLFIASYPSIKDTLSAGTITVVFSSMMALLRPLKSLTNVNSQFQRGMAACQSLFELMDLPIEEDLGTKEVTRVRGDIEFKDVCFYYPKNNNPTLKMINFSIPAGQTVALVGRSGSGKSTIASLLPRFYDIQSGSILIDEQDIYSYTLASLRDQIGFVSQQIHLFNDTIENNILYGYKKPCTRDEVIRIAKMAHAMDFIEKLEHGLDTIIGENGLLLSGGQRQRIAIARALLRNHPILILDEATSALDTESERIIQSALNELQQNRTALVIAHRLSTIENAHTILVIEEGKIVERGNHQELLAQQGIYAQLHKIQFGQQL